MAMDHIAQKLGERMGIEWISEVILCPWGMVCQKNTRKIHACDLLMDEHIIHASDKIPKQESQHAPS